MNTGSNLFFFLLSFNDEGITTVALSKDAPRLFLMLVVALWISCWYYSSGCTRDVKRTYKALGLAVMSLDCWGRSCRGPPWLCLCVVSIQGRLLFQMWEEVHEVMTSPAKYSETEICSSSGSQRSLGFCCLLNVVLCTAFALTLDYIFVPCAVQEWVNSKKGYWFCWIMGFVRDYVTWE